ncbi:MAG: Rrf2 family transcriptional regulator [Spirochaetales bacterium]|nr:Rrf2 family transcriptional regulator [Spirochaetales bacterium]
MKLSAKTRYAVRLMVNLALNYRQGPVQLNEISAKEGISEKYLGQIVITLRSAGLVRSVRGAKGGYLLVNDPSEVSLKDIVEIMEGGMDIIDKFENEESGSSEMCITSHVWDKVGRAINEVLENIKLNELAHRVQEESRPMYFI